MITSGTNIFDQISVTITGSSVSFDATDDSDGYIQVDDSVLSNSLANNYEDIKELFTGYAEKEGIGTRLKI